MLKEMKLERTRSYNATTGVGSDGFPFLSPSTFGRRIEEITCEKNIVEVEQCGRWPQQACTTMFFTIPMNVMGERAIHLNSLVGVVACA